MEAVKDFPFFGSKITAAMKWKDIVSSEENLGLTWQCIKKQRHHLADKDLYSQSYNFSSSHVWMWELDYKESWAPKNWCFRTVVLEKTLCREPAWGTPPMAKVMRKEALAYAKVGIEAQETPCSRASTPKTRVYLLYCFMLSPIPLTLRGSDPHYLSRRRS